MLMTTSRLHSQGPGRPPWTPIRSGWPDWVGPAAAGWSLGYGLLGLYWTFGGAGFPFGTDHDPHAAKVSILEQVQQDAAAPVISAVGLGGAALATVLARRRARGRWARRCSGSPGAWRRRWPWSFPTSVR
jgi:hypothetical protein